MDTAVSRVGWLGVVVGVVAGCSKIERVEEVVAFADRASRVNDQRLRVIGDPLLGVDALPGTSFEAIPQSGTATYLGSAFLSIRNSDNRLDADALVGDSRLVIDFGRPDDAISGGVTNFRLTQRADVSEDIPGQLTFDDGQIGGDQPNDLAFDFGGSLTIDGIDFGLQGRAEGKLRGTRTEPGPDESPVRAYAVRDGQIEITASVGTYAASMTVIGEN